MVMKPNVDDRRHCQNSLAHPDFVTCSTYVKAGRAWYLFSHEDDVIAKWQKKSSEVSCIVQPTTCSMLGVYNSHLPLARYMW